jgi:hypothetical protein
MGIPESWKKKEVCPAAGALPGLSKKRQIAADPNSRTEPVCGNGNKPAPCAKKMYFRASRHAGPAHHLQGLIAGFSAGLLASSIDLIFIANYARPACAKGLFNA